MRKEDRVRANTELCEQLISFANIHEAVNKVMQNKGSAGIDGMEVTALPSYFEAHWMEIREQIVTRTYKPQPVEIPKDNGGVRLLGIPTAEDRVIQQALVQVLTPCSNRHSASSALASGRAGVLKMRFDSPRPTGRKDTHT